MGSEDGRLKEEGRECREQAQLNTGRIYKPRPLANQSGRMYKSELSVPGLFQLHFLSFACVCAVNGFLMYSIVNFILYKTSLHACPRNAGYNPSRDGWEQRRREPHPALGIRQRHIRGERGVSPQIRQTRGALPLLGHLHPSWDTDSHNQCPLSPSPSCLNTRLLASH